MRKPLEVHIGGMRRDGVSVLVARKGLYLRIGLAGDGACVIGIEIGGIVVHIDGFICANHAFT